MFASAHVALQDAAVRGSVKTVQVKGKDSGWLSMTNVWGAAWEIQQSPQPPLDFRVVDDSGSEVRRPCMPRLQDTGNSSRYSALRVMRASRASFHAMYLRCGLQAKAHFCLPLQSTAGIRLAHSCE